MFVRVRNRLLNYPVPIVKNGTQRYSAGTEVTKSTPQEVVYPPIIDLSRKGKKKREKDTLAEKIKKLETVEEKMFAINMPRYYGWKSIMLHEGTIPYNVLPQAQYITRTHVVPENKLPDHYESVISTKELDQLVYAVKSQIKGCITFENHSRLRDPVDQSDLQSKRNADKIIGSAIASQINRILLANLSTKYTHLFQLQTDFDPRVEAFWFAGGIEPTLRTIKAKENVEWLKDEARDPVDRAFQYKGSPILQHRHEFPLKEFISLSESENTDLDVPQFKYDPRTIGYHHDRTHATIIPGFWPGDPAEFGFLSYHNCDYLAIRDEPYNDIQDALTVQAIFASFGWLYSQACYQGFSTYNELTYPLTTQTVITNGQWWTFCAYQLNTVLLHSNFADENPRRNMCWITEPMKLYDTVENGKVRGLNENVIKHLIRFHANVPEKREINMKPYLGENVKVIADIEEDERRAWLERNYKHLVSNRPRHRRLPEIPQWHRIYIIKHKKRLMEKKREPWQFGIDLLRRRLDDHQPAYIPKCYRENPKKKKIGRWEKTYYPDV